MFANPQAGEQAIRMETLKKSSEFGKVRRTGRTWASGPVLLNAAPNDLDITRCGFVTGKKIGNAVKRNRARRLMKEAVRLRLPYLKPGFDLVWIARQSIEGARLGTVLEAVDSVLHRGKLFAPPDPANAATAGEFSRIIDTGKTEGSPLPAEQHLQKQTEAPSHEEQGPGAD